MSRHSHTPSAAQSRPRPMHPRRHLRCAAATRSGGDDPPALAPAFLDEILAEEDDEPASVERELRPGDEDRGQPDLA